jgi:type VI secretion system protein ImpG
VSDDLLEIYRRELGFLKNEASEFGKAYPSVAARLQLTPGRSSDPHIERILQGVAYLTARIRQKLDDDYPELAEAILNIVCPHYLRPVPSAAIVQFELDERQRDLAGGHRIPTETLVETDLVDGTRCRFQTRYPVTLWPIRLKGASYRESLGKFSPPTGKMPRAALKLDFETFGPLAPFATLATNNPNKPNESGALNSLRLYVNGSSGFQNELYEQLVNNVVGFALARSDADESPVFPAKIRVKPVGFEASDSLLPVESRSMWGYQLLTEFFAFPDRFLFVDIEGFELSDLSSFGTRLQLYIYFSRHDRNLERFVTEDSLCLGCAPVVNLFPNQADHIALDHTKTEYLVSPNAGNRDHCEVYSIESVKAFDSQNNLQPYAPFFAHKHHMGDRAFWHASRRPRKTLSASGGTVPSRGTAVASGEELRGSDVYLSLVDPNFQPSQPDGAESLLVEAVCSNGNAPHLLMSQGGDAVRRWDFQSGGTLATARSMTTPTESFAPAMGRGRIWRLVSHLSLNYLSLISDDRTGADALRELLALYEVTNSKEKRDMIEGIESVNVRRVVRRIPPDPRFPLEDDSPGFCRGLEITLKLNRAQFSGGSPLLFASVLERFFALYASHNSFTQLIAMTSENTVIRKWEPRAGDRVLV